MSKIQNQNKNMNIKILDLLEGAREATGLTVIIDVFRAFSTACYAFDRGVSRIIPVAGIEKAFKMKKEYPEYILAGERSEKKPEGFDFGNSPTHLKEADLKGKILVHTTSSGTQGIEAAKNASELITGSFVNAAAIIQYIKSVQPLNVSLVCMGYACEYPTDEDTLCARYIKNELEGKENDFTKYSEIIRKGSGARFFDPKKQEWSPDSDFDLCMQLNRFNFVLKVIKDHNFNYLKKITVLS